MKMVRQFDGGKESMAGKNISSRKITDSVSRHVSGSKEVPIQVMVPEAVRRQVALMSADRGENMRTVVLRGLKAIGIEVPESELGDRRGRRRSASGRDNGAQ